MVFQIGFKFRLGAAESISPGRVDRTQLYE